MSEATRIALPCPTGPRSIAARLETAGHDAWLVGECLHELVIGEPPRGWAMSSSASAEQIVACLPEAVPTRANGLAFVVPTASGPLDLSPLRRGRFVECDLEARGFTVFAMAWSPNVEQLKDPHGGRADALGRKLRTVGPADEALAAAPLRALQAARLVAEHGYVPDEALLRALAALSGKSLHGSSAAALRREMSRILQGDHAGDGLRVLRETGIERQIANGTSGDIADLVDDLPHDLVLRLTAWLRGAGGARTLRRLRVDRERSQRVLRLLQAHPIEVGIDPRRRSALRRLRSRLTAEDRRGLFALRTLELEHAAESREAASQALQPLRTLEQAIEADLADCERARSIPDPVLKGDAVMRILGLEPGPGVGRALAHLRDCVAADPDCNTPEALGERLRAWAADHEVRGGTDI